MAHGSPFDGQRFMTPSGVETRRASTIIATFETIETIDTFGTIDMTDPSSTRSSPVDEHDDDAVDEIVRSGPRGAIAVAGVATAVVIALWFAFYFWVFLPRGVIQ